MTSSNLKKKWSFGSNKVLTYLMGYVSEILSSYLFQGRIQNPIKHLGG